MPRLVRYLFYLLVIIVVINVSFRWFGPFGLIIALIILFAVGVWKVSQSN